MSQQTVIRITSTDRSDEGDYLGGEFDGGEWKLSLAEGFVVLNARGGLGRVVIPAHRVREVEVVAVQQVTLAQQDELSLVTED